MKRLWLAIVSVTFLAVLFAGIALAQNRESTLATIMKLPAAERQAQLLSGAKKGKRPGVVFEHDGRRRAGID